MPDFLPTNPIAIGIIPALRINRAYQSCTSRAGQRPALLKAHKAHALHPAFFKPEGLSMACAYQWLPIGALFHQLGFNNCKNPLYY